MRRIESTRPARGATPLPTAAATTTLCFNPRAPHGARHQHLDSLPLPRGCFNPRARAAFGFLDRAVSIHAPRTGRDVDLLRLASAGTSVSIHAPRTGRDQKAMDLTLKVEQFQSTRPGRGATAPPLHSLSWTLGFNPRAPHGARHGSIAALSDANTFQSTRPARGATGAMTATGAT